MDTMEKAIGVVLLLILAGSSLAVSTSCQTNQYRYKCNTCFAIEDHPQSFNLAHQFCRDRRGHLLQLKDNTDFSTIKRYLKGLKETRKLWIGYRYNNSNDRVSADGGVASSVILQDENFNHQANQPDEMTCIAINGSFFSDVPCSNQLHPLCAYDYSAITVIDQSERMTFGSSNLSLHATLPLNGVGDTEWRLNDSKITNNQDGFLLSTTTRSHTKQIKLQVSSFNAGLHVGTYSLLITTVSGKYIVAHWKVVLPVLGSFLHEPQNLQITANQLAAFQCHASHSFPPYEITWYKDRRPVDVDASRGRLHVSPDTGTLYIRNVGMGDSGMYQCKVANIAGERMSSSGQLSIMQDPPTSDTTNQGSIYIRPRNTSVLEGEDFVMECVGKLARTAATYTRFYRRPDIGRAVHSFMYPQATGMPQYRLENVSLEQSGLRFSCDFVPESLMSIVHQQTTLTVHAPIAITHILSSHQGVIVDAPARSLPLNSNVTISCRYKGAPPPTAIVWYRNGTQVGNGADLSLNVNNFRESDIYQCVAFNQHGTGHANHYLCLEDPDAVPGPVSFQVQADTNSSIYLEWDAVSSNADNVLIQYEVTVSITSSPMVAPADISTVYLWDRRSAVVSGLRPNTLYRVMVRASSLKGFGPTTEKQVRTFPNTPSEPIPVSNFTVKRSRDGESLIIQWILYTPTNWTSGSFPVHTYQVQYRLINQTSDIGGFINVSGRERVATVSNLLNHSENYEARVRVQLPFHRDPSQYTYSPWSEYREVDGVTTLPSPSPTEGINGNNIMKNGTLVIILVVVVLVLIIIVAVILGVMLYYWHHKKPGGVYSIAAAQQRRKNRYKVAFEASTDTNNSHQTPIPNNASLGMTTHAPSNDVNTCTDFPGRHGVPTISVVDTSRILGRRHTGHGADSWTEEFDHLESLVTTLNDTVSSMTTPLQDNSASSLSPSPTTNEIAVSLSCEEGDKDGNDEALNAELMQRSDASEHHKPHVNSNLIEAEEEGGSPPASGGVDPEGNYNLINEGSDTSIIKENPGALESDSSPPVSDNDSRMKFPQSGRFPSSSTGMDLYSSTNTIETVIEVEKAADSAGDEMDAAASESNLALAAGSEVGCNEGGRSVEVKEMDVNFVELLQFGDSMDLQMERRVAPRHMV